MDYDGKSSYDNDVNVPLADYFLTVLFSALRVLFKRLQNLNWAPSCNEPVVNTSRRFRFGFHLS